MKEYHRIIFIPGDLRVVYTKTPNKIFLICPELDPFQICVTGRKRPHGWKTMLLRSTFMGPSQISANPIHRPFSRIPAKPNQVAIVAIHELSLRKFRKMGRMTSFAVVSLIETSFPFYEWYKLRLFSFNTITQSSIYTYKGGGRSEERGGRSEEGGGVV